MNELGHWLREAREAQELSLAEVEDRTRIRSRFLSALEAEEWDVLPGSVTTRGFLRKYARFLGLDPDVALERYKAAVKPESTQPTALEAPEPREVDYRPIELDLHAEEIRQFPWRLVVGLLALLVILVSAWWVVSFRPGWIASAQGVLLRAIRQPADLVPVETTPEPTATRIVIRVTATPSDTPEVTPTLIATPVVLPTDDMPSPVPQSPTPGPSVSPVDAILLHLDVNQRAWIRVTVDGETRFEGNLEIGAQRDWEGRQTVSLRTGNASGVQVTLNGRAMQALGGPGEVVEVVWQIEGGQVVQKTPVPTTTPSLSSSPDLTSASASDG